MKILGYIIIIFIAVFSFFGLLICIEYLKYFKRKIVLNLNSKLHKEVSNNDQIVLWFSWMR